MSSCSSYGVMIPRSNTSFYNLPSSPPLPGAVAASFRRCVSFQTRTRLPSIRAAINDGNYPDSPTISLLDSMSFYERLGIPENGSFGEIKKAYKLLVRKYHPDVSPPDRVAENIQLFLRVQEAYETLSDPEQRAIYDKNYMSRGIHMAFSAKKIYRSNEIRQNKSEWKVRWQTQVSELKNRRTNVDTRVEPKNMSWGAQMRRQRKKEEEDMFSES